MPKEWQKKQNKTSKSTKETVMMLPPLKKEK